MYFYDRLSAEKKKIYRKMVQGIDEMQTMVSLPGAVLTKKELEALHYMIRNDNPRIFWTENSFSYSVVRVKREEYIYSPKYRFSPEQKKAMEREILEKEKMFLTGIRFSMTPYEKALRLYENFPRLIKYDSDATVGARKAKRRYNLDDCSTIYGAFVRQRAVCEGYARAYQYLLNKFGVKCMVVIGDIRGGGGHAWNLVDLGDGWYHVDVTWGDQIKSFVEGKIDYTWFGLADRDIKPIRTIDRDLAYPACNRSEFNYYVRNNAYLERWTPGSLAECVRRLIRVNQYKRIQLRFASPESLRDAWNYLIADNRIFELYRAEGIEASSMWHSVDDEMNVLTFWTEFQNKRSRLTFRV